MATFGRVDEFKADTKVWDSYVERVDRYFEANGIVDEAKKWSILLSVCGAKTYDLAQSLMAPSKPTEQTYQQLTELLKAHYNPRPSAIMQRCKFYSHLRH